MRTFIVIVVLIVPWALIAPWLVKGYSPFFHFPNPLNGVSGLILSVFVYLPPMIATTLVARKILKRTNAPNQ